jgi:hypothetical protein
VLPRYSWTYKHLGVVDYIRVHNSLPRKTDIYFDWPGFFTSVNWLNNASGVTTVALARWAPPAFELLNVLGVVYLARSLTRDIRVVSLSAILFTISMWVGQDYFSPQALAFFLGLVFIGAAIRLLRPTEPAQGRAREWAGLKWVLLGLLWLAILTTHQLTPGVTLLVFVLIAFFFKWRNSLGFIAFMVVTELIWVGLALPYLHDTHYPLLSLDPLQGSGLNILADFTPISGAGARSIAVYALYFGMFLAGLVAAALSVRHSRTSRAMAAGAIAPALVLLVQDYGGEGQLRTYLFALPYLAFLIATLIAGPRLAELAGVRKLVSVGVALVIAALFLPAYLGQDLVVRVVPADLAAMTWFYDNAPNGAEPIYFVPNVPLGSTAQYVDHPLQAESSPVVLSDGNFRKDMSAQNVVNYLATRPGTLYLVATPSEVGYMQYYGVSTPARFAALTDQLDSNAQLKLVYRADGASVWEYLRP